MIGLFCLALVGYVVALIAIGLYLREGRRADAAEVEHVALPDSHLHGMLAVAASREGDGRLLASLSELDYVNAGCSALFYDDELGAFVYEWTPIRPDLPPSMP